MRMMVLAMGVWWVAVPGSMAELALSGSPIEVQEHLSSLPGQVTISGAAERRVEADQAIVQLAVVTTERLLESAMVNNTSVRSQIVATLAEASIPEARIHTSRFASTPLHSSWTGKVKEYRIKSSVRVHAESEQEIHLVAGLVDSLDDVSLSSMTFDVTGKDKIVSALIEEALERVNERKAQYEGALNVKLRPKRVGLPVPDKSPRDVHWPMSGDERLLRLSSGLTNPELTLTLHALEQREPELSQFEELLYKVGIVVTFDVLAQP